jgi:hypothetical protein
LAGQPISSTSELNHWQVITFQRASGHTVWQVSSYLISASGTFTQVITFFILKYLFRI